MSDKSRLYSVRGAICCENTKKSISEHVPLLFREILTRNSINEDEIVSCVFSVTKDLTVLNPATALRMAGLAQNISLFACMEPYIEGYLPFVIRLLITYYGNKKPVPVYLNGAEILRPDFAENMFGKTDLI